MEKTVHFQFAPTEAFRMRNTSKHHDLCVRSVLFAAHRDFAGIPNPRHRRVAFGCARASMWVEPSIRPSGAIPSRYDGYRCRRCCNGCCAFCRRNNKGNRGRRCSNARCETADQFPRPRDTWHPVGCRARACTNEHATTAIDIVARRVTRRRCFCRCCVQTCRLRQCNARREQTNQPGTCQNTQDSHPAPHKLRSTTGSIPCFVER